MMERRLLLGMLLVYRSLASEEAYDLIELGHTFSHLLPSITRLRYTSPEPISSRGAHAPQPQPYYFESRPAVSPQLNCSKHFSFLGTFQGLRSGDLNPLHHKFLLAAGCTLVCDRTIHLDGHASTRAETIAVGSKRSAAPKVGTYLCFSQQGAALGGGCTERRPPCPYD